MGPPRGERSRLHISYLAYTSTFSLHGKEGMQQGSCEGLVPSQVSRTVKEKVLLA